MNEKFEAENTACEFREAARSLNKRSQHHPETKGPISFPLVPVAVFLLPPEAVWKAAAGDTVTRQCDWETTTDFKRLWGKTSALENHNISQINTSVPVQPAAGAACSARRHPTKKTEFLGTGDLRTTEPLVGSGLSFCPCFTCPPVHLTLWTTAPDSQAVYPVVSCSSCSPHTTSFGKTLKLAQCKMTEGKSAAQTLSGHRD